MEQQTELPKQFIFIDYQPNGIRDTSLKAFNSIIDSLPISRLLVFRAVQDLGGKANNNMIHKRLGWDINRVTPRVSELRKLGVSEK